MTERVRGLHVHYRDAVPETESTRKQHAAEVHSRADCWRAALFRVLPLL